MVQLRAMSDGDFAWLLGELPAPAGAPSICDGGVAPPPVIALIRGVAAGNREKIAGPVAWLIVVAGEAVGMVSFTHVRDVRRPEIGYGTADSRRRRGHAGAAIAVLCKIARNAGLDGLTAETAIDNRASQLVLERNGFRRTGERHDAEDGDLYQWAMDLNDD